MRILLVEDERAFAAVLARGLTAEGYAVDVAHDGRSGLLLASTGAYAMIVLDLMLPVMSGYAVCTQLRRDGVTTPILVLTAKDGDLDQVEALDAGADDYLTKPFSYSVLVAHLRALTRRAPALAESELTVGDLTIDTARRTCHRGDTLVSLTPRELAILEMLARAGGRVVAKDELALQLWVDEDVDDNAIEARVSALRRKVDRPFGRASIETIRGSGYRLVDDAPA